MRATALCLVLATTALSLPVHAQARVVAKLRFDPVVGPVLVDSEAVWGQYGSNSLLLKSSDGATTSTPYRLDVDGATLAASGRRLLVEQLTSQSTSTAAASPAVRAFSAQTGDPLQPLASEACAFTDFLGGAAVSGDVFAYHDDGCQIVVRDISRSDAGFHLPSDASSPRLAGPYVAFLQGPVNDGPGPPYRDVVVWERATQQEVLRVPAASLPREILSFSLDADGTAVLVHRGDAKDPYTFQRKGIVSASPAQPSPKELLPAAGFFGARVSGGDVVFVTEQAPSASSTVTGSLQTLDLATGRRHLLARSVEDATGYGSPRFDYDGQHVAWLSRTCSSVLVNVASPASPPAPPAKTARCPLKVIEPPRASGKFIRLRVSCAGLDRNCRLDRPTLSAVGSRGGRVVVARDASENVYAKKSQGRARLRMTAIGRRMLRHHQHLRVRLSVALLDEDMNYNRTASRRQVLTAVTRR